ncbi:MAG: hypothetical protein JO191_09310 [Mycobacteriaceae bacterium]|nr:hypothetical protein [Mycobacteriaceae bacterium]
MAATLMGFHAQKAQAFFIQNHELITRNALPANQVSSDAMLQILVGPPPGAGDVGADAFATDEWRHLDNSVTPADICTRAMTAWNTYSPILLSGSKLAGAGLVNGPAARAAFGGLLHAQQDFYAHSNWVEDNIAAGDLNRIAPQIFPTCNPSDFPADLHTGYYSINFSQQFPLQGCPPDGPPPPFQECHLTLNKDGPGTIRGSQPVPGTNMVNYDLAAQLATTATTNLYNQLRAWLVQNNGDQATNLLFQTGGPQWVLPALGSVYQGTTGN